MPCTDGGWPYPEHRDESAEEVRLTTAMLCQLVEIAQEFGILDTMLSKWNTEKSGVSKQKLKAWITRHQRLDRAGERL